MPFELKAIYPTKLYSISEVGILLKDAGLDVTIQSLHNYRKQGKLKAVRVGNSYAITGQSVMDFLRGIKGKGK